MRANKFKDYVRNRTMVISLLPFLAVSVYFTYNFYHSTISLAKESHRLRTANIAGEIKQLLYYMSINSAHLAESKSIREVSVDIVYSQIALGELQAYSETHPELTSILISDRFGYIVDGFPVQSLALNPRTTSQITRHIVNRDSKNKEPALFFATNQQLDYKNRLKLNLQNLGFFILASPLVINTESLIHPQDVSGALLTIIAVDNLIDKVSSGQDSTWISEDVVLIAGKQKIYDKKNQPLDPKNTISSVTNVISALDYLGHETSIKLITSDSKSALLKSVNKNILITLLTMAGLTLFVLILIRKITASFSGPLAQVVSSAHAFSHEHYNKIEIESEFEEFQDINHALNVMADTIQDQFTTLDQQRNRAESSERSKSEFLANMSHEIRTPINGVIGMIRLLEKTELNENQRQKIQLAKNSAHSLLDIINDILDFSKIEANKLEIENIEFNIIDLISNTTLGLGIKAHEKNIELILDLSDIQHQNIVSDPARIRQILVNLVGNAIKFTPIGEIVISANTLEIDDAHTALTINVQDSGIGIPEDNQAKLFDAFTQEDASTTRRFGGTGLGLSITKKLCKLLSGDIHVKSTIGKGSTFTVTLELNTASNPVPSNRINRGIPFLSGKDFLIYHPNKAFLAALKQQFSAFEIAHLSSTFNFKDAKDKILEDTIHYHYLVAPSDSDLCLWIESNKLLQRQLISAGTRIITIHDFATSATPGNKTSSLIVAEISKPVIPKKLRDTLLSLADVDSTPFVNKAAIDEPYLLPTKDASPLIANSPYSVEPYRNKTEIQSKRFKVLLVEDNEINQEVVLGLLEDAPLDISVADDGIVALEKLNDCDTKAPFELILMDCQMPHMDGFETSRAIRIGNAGEHYKNTPIVALTANAMKGDKEACIDAGMSDYISKPIDPDIMQEKLNHWLNATMSFMDE